MSVYVLLISFAGASAEDLPPQTLIRPRSRESVRPLFRLALATVYMPNPLKSKGFPKRRSPALTGLTDPCRTGHRRCNPGGSPMEKIPTFLNL